MDQTLRVNEEPVRGPRNDSLDGMEIGKFNQEAAPD